MSRRLMLRNENGATPILPPEYQQVEWIGSSGTQYINTGVNISASQGFEIDTNWTYTTNAALIGSAGQINRSDYVLCTWSNIVLFQYNGSNGVGNYFGNRHIFTALANKLYIDGDLKVSSTKGAFTIPTNVKIFWAGANSYGGAIANKAKAIVYGARLFGTDFETINNYVPCYRKADGEIGMYDTVSNTFFANAGTGTFTKGADVD